MRILRSIIAVTVFQLSKNDLVKGMNEWKQNIQVVQEKADRARAEPLIVGRSVNRCDSSVMQVSRNITNCSSA